MEEIQLKRGASDVIAFLKPFGVALDRFQCDSCPIGENFEIWMSISNQTPGIYIKLLEKRRKMAICPVVLAANLLDHRYSRLHLSPIEVQEAMQYIGENNKAFLPQVSTLIARHEPFNEDLFSDAYKNLSLATWWKSGVKRGFKQRFCRVFCRPSRISYFFGRFGAPIFYNWDQLRETSQQFGCSKSREIFEIKKK